MSLQIFLASSLTLFFFIPLKTKSINITTTMTAKSIIWVFNDFLNYNYSKNKKYNQVIYQSWLKNCIPRVGIPEKSKSVAFSHAELQSVEIHAGSQYNIPKPPDFLTSSDNDVK